MGKYPVTQEEYEQLTGFNPSYHKGPVVALTDTRRFPVEKVSWPEAKLFCDLLSKKLLPKNFRLAKLPTELEWEYASRGGTRTPFSFGDLLNGIEANCDGSNPYGTESKGPYLKRPRDVGSYRPNPFGLFDMHGNVWEWCEDGWDEKAYEKKRGSDVQIEPANDRRILRGGSWSSAAKLCRSAHREWFVGSYRDNTYGFRVLLRYGEA
jgi:formylglycine-generating enzyme required for sulfatase activity